MSVVLKAVWQPPFQSEMWYGYATLIKLQSLSVLWTSNMNCTQSSNDKDAIFQVSV